MGDNGERWEKPPEEHCRTQAPRVASPPQEKQRWPIVKGVQEGHQPRPKVRTRETEDSRPTKSHPAAVKTRSRMAQEAPVCPAAPRPAPLQ
eukprot:103576-Chlamydomonas_euryale.AAC.1